MEILELNNALSGIKILLDEVHSRIVIAKRRFGEL